MAKKKLQDDGWTPIAGADGTYCSRLCGGRCTRKDYLLATRRANMLVRRLGGGFRPKVVENLGWHYAAVLTAGVLTLRVLPIFGRTGEVSAYFALLGQVGGMPEWTEKSAYFPIPEQAVVAQLARAREWLHARTTSLAEIDTAMAHLTDR